MTKMYAISARFIPAPEDGWESSGIELPTFYLHPNAQAILGEGGAKVIAESIFAPFFARGHTEGEMRVFATEVDV